MAWHGPQCSSLELIWDDGKPGCRACSSWAPQLSVVHASPPPKPPPHTRRSELTCTWPPCLELHDDPDLEELTSFIRDNVDEWSIDQVLKGESKRAPVEYQQISSSSKTSLNDDIYQELTEPGAIRLLCLHGSTTFESPIHCSFQKAVLGDPCIPIYEALSYTWADLEGDARLSQAVFIGPQYHILPATQNCASALRRFRTDKDRLIWVDAICINQSDPTERGHQVALMQEIYSLSARVLIYVGEGGKKTDQVMNSLLNRLPVPEDGFKESISRPYFSRAWVIQEVKLSLRATVTCGSKTVTLEALRRAKDGNAFVNEISWIACEEDSIFKLIIQTKAANARTQGIESTPY